MTSANPVVTVSAVAAKALRKGVPWCYRQEVAVSPSGIEPGAVVDVVDPQRNPIGQAFWASKSPLALRLLSRRNGAVDPVGPGFFRARFAAALERRASLARRDAYRVIHGEADLVPGLFVDRYGDALTVQTLSEGADLRKREWAEMLAALTKARLVACRDDASGRDFEGLPRERLLLMGEGSSVVRYHEGPNQFEVDLLGGAKTGSFLDQVDNHLRAGELAFGAALDAFAYHGGFSLALSRSCTSVLAVEQDPVAAEAARRNVEVNGRANVVVESANAFDRLRELEAAGRRFDTVVLDPPGFAKRREGLSAARRAYHELNLRALKLLSPGGLLVTCSCSGKVTRAAFEAMVLEAAADARRQVQLLERRGAGIDHPTLGGLADSEYLKAYFLRAL